MKIHPTNKWLIDWIDQRPDHEDNDSLQQTIICKPLAPYFNSASTASIQQHLLNHGMFAPNTEPSQILNWVKQSFHSKVRKAIIKCQQMWDGPDTNIFIFPSNEETREFKQWYNSNSGLSFPDKLLLFLQTKATNGEILALTIHEYSHICRLNHFRKKEHEYTIIDAVILEGIAEWLVRKYVGEEYGNKRLTSISNDELKRLWNKWVKPYQTLTRVHPKHNTIMYGKPGKPKNIGYIIGFQLIEQFMKKKSLSAKELLQTPNQDILKQCEL